MAPEGPWVSKTPPDGNRVTKPPDGTWVICLHNSPGHNFNRMVKVNQRAKPINHRTPQVNYLQYNARGPDPMPLDRMVNR